MTAGTDNTTLPGDGDVYAADDIDGIKFQRAKLTIGGDGVNEGDVYILRTEHTGSQTATATIYIIIGDRQVYTFKITSVDSNATTVTVTVSCWWPCCCIVIKDGIADGYEVALFE